MSHFYGLIDFIGSHPQFAFAAVLVFALSESIPVIGTVVPGSTLILGISALATTADLNPWILLIAAVVGAIAGDGLSFWLGYRYHREILRGWPLNRFPNLVRRSVRFIRRHGIASVFLARFTAVVRAFVPLVAGVLRMPSGHFYVANILSALVWAPIHVFPGVLAGIALSLAGPGTTKFILFILVCLLVASIAWHLVKERPDSRFDTSTEERSQLAARDQPNHRVAFDGPIKESPSGNDCGAKRGAGHTLS